MYTLTQATSRHVDKIQQVFKSINERRSLLDQYNLIELTMRKEPNRTFWFLFCRIVT